MPILSITSQRGPKVNRNKPLFLSADPVLVPAPLDDEIADTLTKTRQKLTDLTQTADRMNRIIDDAKAPRVRGNRRRSDIWKFVVGLVMVFLVVSNAAMGYYLVKMDREHIEFAEVDKRNREQLVMTVRCLINDKTADHSSCIPTGIR